MDPNNDKVAGTINTAVGNIKEVVGKATQDKDLENEGAVQKTKGQIEKLTGALKDVVQQGQDLLGKKSE
jgi:uncharacterized protein YjbJ (UPF0337 family)